MLCLSRKQHETICIGHDIRVHVVAILRDKVRLGIEAPKEVPVHRLEVYNAINAKAESGKRKAESGMTMTEPRQLGRKTSELLVALADGPLSYRKCQAICSGALPRLIKARLAGCIGRYGEGAFFVATDLGIDVAAGNVTRGVCLHPSVRPQSRAPNPESPS